MAKLITYSPNGILLPEEAVRRYIRLLTGTLWYWDVGDATLQWSDSYALIHDVFKSTDGTRIYAIDSSWHILWRQRILDAFHALRVDSGIRIGYDRKGVRFELDSSAIEELAEMMPKMADEFRLDGIFYQGRPLQYSYHDSSYTINNPYQRNVMGLYEIKPTPQMAAEEAVELEFSFGGGKYRQSVSVSEHPFADMIHTPYLLHTMQKDNEPDWVADWCRYYHRVHKVQRIVIYDNDSANRDSLEKALMDIKDRMEIALIRWPYEYKGRFNLTQYVALNHCPLLFGDSSDYYMNFDIDEYLVNPTRMQLGRYLNRRRGEKRFWYAIPEIPVPNYIEGNRSGKVPRVYDYKYRLDNKIENWKTINVFGRFRVLTEHSTYGKNQSQPGSGPTTRIRRKLRKIGSKLQRRFKWMQRDKLYYNHYKGLATGWRERQRLMPLSGKGTDLVWDTEMEAHLKKAGLK